MVNFIYTPTAEDYIAFEKFKYKKNKTFFISYVFCAMFIAIALYEFFIDKNYSMLVCAVLFTVINFSFFLYT
ncbi:MAG: hypothetical protein K2F67_05560, partial [Eubacterium sp.]|nr:hypothetical protein [Eubacterium sp.]